MSANTTQIKLLPPVFFEMPIDIQGGNIGQIGWAPTEEDFKFIGDEFYKEALAKYVKENERVCFKNVTLRWESCDCGGDYGCSHGSWVYEITISDENGNHTIDIQDGESIYFDNQIEGKQCVIPITASVGDFHRACQICGINLELTDYAINMLKPSQNFNKGEGNINKTAISSNLSMREVAEELWKLLDNIDTLSDICKPTESNPKAAMAFYNNSMRYAGQRFNLLKSDGYKIYTNDEFESLPKSDNEGSQLKESDN